MGALSWMHASAREAAVTCVHQLMYGGGLSACRMHSRTSAVPMHALSSTGASRRNRRAGMEGGW